MDRVVLVRNRPRQQLLVHVAPTCSACLQRDTAGVQTPRRGFRGEQKRARGWPDCGLALAPGKRTA